MRLLTGLVMMAALFLAGCQKEEAKPTAGNVAVVDMEQIAQETGFQQALGERMTQLNKQINDHLQQVQQEMRTQIEKKQADLGQNLNPEQQKELEKLSIDLDNRYRQELSKAQQNSNQAHAAMVGQFRQHVDPIASSVARERGFDIVMSRTEDMLMVAPTADITQQVLNLIKQTGMTAPTQAPAPAPGVNPGILPGFAPTPGTLPQANTPEALNADEQQQSQAQPAPASSPEKEQPKVTLPDKLPVE